MANMSPFLTIEERVDYFAPGSFLKEAVLVRYGHYLLLLFSDVGIVAKNGDKTDDIQRNNHTSEPLMT